MARYAYCGKTTVESCQSIDVLHWNSVTRFAVVLLGPN